MAEKNTPPKCCNGCHYWETVKDKCWVFWHEKAECSMFVEALNQGEQTDEIQHKQVDLVQDRKQDL